MVARHEGQRKFIVRHVQYTPMKMLVSLSNNIYAQVRSVEDFSRCSSSPITIISLPSRFCSSFITVPLLPLSFHFVILLIATIHPQEPEKKSAKITPTLLNRGILKKWPTRCHRIGYLHSRSVSHGQRLASASPLQPFASFSSLSLSSSSCSRGRSLKVG